MKTLATLLLSLCLLVAVPGCPGRINPDGTPISRTEDATISTNDAVTAAVKIINGAVKSGHLKASEVDPWLPVLRSARAAAKQVQAELDAGNVEGAKLYAASARAALTRLQPLLTWIAERKAATE